MIEQPIRVVRSLTPEQRDRIHNSHKASVKVSDTGNLEYLTETIITPKQITKQNTRVSVIPDPNEKVVKITDVPYLFSEIGHMNVILTNACNMSCSYCYEQHNKDFGRFTEESLLEAYNFLLKHSKQEFKRFQFFGGEPLIHKDLILSFLRKHKDYLAENFFNSNHQSVSSITNGILLSKEFIEEYFSYDFTWLMVSLDTLDAKLDHRELEQVQIDKILESIKLVPENAKRRVWMRATISRETAPVMREYIDKIYELGIRSVIIHPLILDSNAGFISWPEEEWAALHKTLVDVITEYDDLEVSFSEGVGVKGENNCMIGSDMIAIDGSGDFSGCYFFTNHKAGVANKTILGNIFNDKVYIDRYQGFQKAFLEMFESEEQCNSCNYKNHCYQCPAGNLDTGPKLFRPDDMCQKVVKLYLDLQNDLIRKQFKMKFEHAMREVQADPTAFSKTAQYIMFVMLAGRHASVTEDKTFLDLPETKVYAIWKHILSNKCEVDTSSFNAFLSSLPDVEEDISEKELYEFMLNQEHIPTQVSQAVTEQSFETKVGYFVLLQLFAVNHKNKNLQGVLTQKILEGSE